MENSYIYKTTQNHNLLDKRALLTNYILSIFLSLSILILLPLNNTIAASSIIALVNDEAISSYDLEQRIKFRLAIGNMANSRANRARIKKTALEALINEKIIIQEARKYNLKASDKEVDQAIAQIAKNNKASVSKLAKFIGRYGAKLKTWKAQIRARKSWNSLVVNKYRKGVSVDEDYLDRRVSKSNSIKAKSTTVYDFRELNFFVKTKAEKKQRMLDIEALRRNSNSCIEAIKNSKPLPRVKTSKLLEIASNKVKDKKFLKILSETPVNRVSKTTEYKDRLVVYAICKKTSKSSNEVKRDVVMKQLFDKELNLQADRHLKDLRRDAIIEYK